MPNFRRAQPFWRRREPTAGHDVAELLPASLNKDERFETLEDAQGESARSEAVLAAYRPRNQYSVYLRECREGYYACEQTYCPVCARTFRRYFIGESLRICDGFNGSIKFSTVLLGAAPKGKLKSLEIARHDAGLRKRLVRAGLRDVVVVGGLEMIYRARQGIWVLHINLAFLGGEAETMAAFERTFQNSDLYRPVVTVDLQDRPQQLSYLLKFTTYHRPFAQIGPAKSPAKPLNPDLHYELVCWMAQHEFADHMFLFNARRYGPTITLSSKAVGKA
ncbi:hypothetical protein [Bradyrhizobium sp. CCGUVB14]|uniref:hypothetical protein n=1 Tax=Bradyrhizobium sp. CCGUVB14 TaxID=2949628 RepID=UPI0020B32E5D|nr:hypothetical protein [Bradyrhizobium sp. CCGUVB14]MCP3441981.1 hypothetical protein [Bradyrhizobium sp. CCGUVB14]